MERPLTGNFRADGKPLTLGEYMSHGGYEGLRHAVCEMTPGDVVRAVKDATLFGRGGAGFPTGLKWSFVPMGPDAPSPKYVVCNGDEMEPGTFKDNFLLCGNPHQVLEGILLAGYAVGASVGYLFLRGEYTAQAACVRDALDEARVAGYLGTGILRKGFDFEIHLHMSAGRYICGEETALLNALEGRRANPRTKPPFPARVGLWGKPTVVNNVETLCNVSHIVRQGAEWFRRLSRSASEGGTKLYGVSGRVKNPGVWELPMGTPIREVLDQCAGGMCDGLTARAVIPGGASTAFVLARDFDTPMDFNSMAKIGSRMGAGGMIVLDNKTCPVGMVRNLMQFFARESCGWCTPCREGLPWAANLLDAIERGGGRKEDLVALERLNRFIGPAGHTFCALAPGAMEPLASALKYFYEDFDVHIQKQQCPYTVPRKEVGVLGNV